jgi:hypothetical protein
MHLKPISRKLRSELYGRSVKEQQRHLAALYRNNHVKNQTSFSKN